MDACESGVTDFAEALKYGREYYEKGVGASDKEMRREGVFLIADAFMLVTSFTEDCYTSERDIERTVKDHVIDNFKNPMLLVVNLAVEHFYIISALTVLFADFNYEDWFSLFYWMGDLLYRLIIVDHSTEWHRITG